MSSSNRQHISPRPSLESFLANPKINNFNHLRFLAVKDIFRFDIPMADISVMQILNGPNEFLHNKFELLLVLDLAIRKAGLVKTLHDEVGAMLLDV